MQILSQYRGVLGNVAQGLGYPPPFGTLAPLFPVTSGHRTDAVIKQTTVQLASTPEDLFASGTDADAAHISPSSVEQLDKHFQVVFEGVGSGSLSVSLGSTEGVLFATDRVTASGSQRLFVVVDFWLIDTENAAPNGQVWRWQAVVRNFDGTYQLLSGETTLVALNFVNSAGIPMPGLFLTLVADTGSGFTDGLTFIPKLFELRMLEE